MPVLIAVHCFWYIEIEYEGTKKDHSQGIRYTTAPHRKQNSQTKIDGRKIRSGNSTHWNDQILFVAFFLLLLYYTAAGVSAVWRP